MSKIKKTDLLQLVQEQAEMIAELSAMVELNKMSIIKLENERDIAKELTGSELTGSDLCRKMLERGDRWVMCVVGTHKEVIVINGIDGEGFTSRGSYLNYHTPIPINNQGEPLTQAEAGL